MDSRPQAPNLNLPVSKDYLYRLLLQQLNKSASLKPPYDIDFSYKRDHKLILPYNEAVEKV